MILVFEWTIERVARSVGIQIVGKRESDSSAISSDVRLMLGSIRRQTWIE
jgi:hypothetical protein